LFNVKSLHELKVYIVISIQLLILLSCRNNHPTAEAKKRRNFPMVIDTLGLNDFHYYGFDSSPTWRSTSSYFYYYIGKLQDSIFLFPIRNGDPSLKYTKKIPKNTEFPFAKYSLDLLEKNKLKSAYEAVVDIQIDTTYYISNSYPTFITNISKDTIIIANGRRIELILEAIDSNENWRPIQEDYISFCGNSYLMSTILPPHEFALTLTPVFRGDYSTQLRLKLGSNYSKPFHGKINYRQFEPFYDEHGNPKDEYVLEMELLKN
jgi:hypothetical protein